MEQGVRFEPTVAGMKRCLGTEFLCLLGPDGVTCIFFGILVGPPLRQSGLHCFPSCSYDAIQKQHTTRRTIQSFISSCHQWKTHRAVGIKVRDRDSILLQKPNRRGWFLGQDS